MLRAVGIVVGLVALADLYVRLAPSDPERWHVPLTFNENRDFKSGVHRVVHAPDGLARLAELIGADPFAGSVADGHATWIVRTQVWGFPDYVTAQQDGDTLRLYSRSRFGRSDFGVNRDRAERWLARLQS